MILGVVLFNPRISRSIIGNNEWIQNKENILNRRCTICALPICTKILPMYQGLYRHQASILVHINECEFYKLNKDFSTTLNLYPSFKIQTNSEKQHNLDIVHKLDAGCYNLPCHIVVFYISWETGCIAWIKYDAKAISHWSNTTWLLLEQKIFIFLSSFRKMFQKLQKTRVRFEEWDKWDTVIYLDNSSHLFNSQIILLDDISLSSKRQGTIQIEQQ